MLEPEMQELLGQMIAPTCAESVAVANDIVQMIDNKEFMNDETAIEILKKLDYKQTLVKKILTICGEFVSNEKDE